MITTAARFTDRVENYMKFRPGYPSGMLTVFVEKMGLNASSVVADVGSGTGVSAIPFLKYGCRVIAVEPNAEMRAASLRLLSDHERFTAVNGDAHNTGLGAQSVDLVIAAQAFHWFTDQDTATEFRRIARDGACAALIWNERQLDTTPFLEAYEDLLLEFGKDYEEVRHDRLDCESLSVVFGSQFLSETFPNEQVLDLEGITGRLLSCSYVPAKGESGHDQMVADLEKLFARHAERGKIQLLYDTNVFYTIL